MGFAVVNVFGIKSLTALWPLLLLYGGVALTLTARWAVTQTRPVLLAAATVVGLVSGGFVGMLSTPRPLTPRAVVSQQPWPSAVADAARRVDHQKERLARYIDENLPDIPERLHANCREFQEALAARGLLCVDVGPNAEPAPAPSREDAEGLALWKSYKDAKAHLDRLIAIAE